MKIGTEQMALFGDVYRGRSVVVTGHTGFKGSWLALWLAEMGAKVHGMSLDPQTTPNHWDAAAPAVVSDIRLDIRDASRLRQTIVQLEPEIVFHLAAQPLVRASYRDPLTTWSTNVMGTANLLDACRDVPALSAMVLITTDKCYENQEWAWGYRETDRLGGHDPYSASKAATEILIESYRKSFYQKDRKVLVASGRAGNVIGGGDWSEDRLIPDLVRAVGENRALEIRSPASTRPWQHVLESLSGYLLLGQSLLNGKEEHAKAWNFGPTAEGNRSVAEVLGMFSAHWPAMRWVMGNGVGPHEAGLLYLDSTLARRDLQWQSVWGLGEACAATAAWYRTWLEEGRLTSREQLEAYVTDARTADLVWSR